MSTDEFLDSLAKPTGEFETYDAVCLCGKVQYSVKLSPPLAQQKVVECNCSVCERNGYLLVYPQRDWLEMKSGEKDLKHVSFGPKRNQHKFCTNCGSSVFFDPRMKEYGLAPPDLLGVNVRMFKDVNVQKLDIIRFDGYNKWPFVGDEVEHLKPTSKSEKTPKTS